MMRTQDGDGRTEPVKLAQVVYELSPGGSEVLAWRIAKALNQGGRYSCSLYAVNRGGPLAQMLAADGIPARAFSREDRLDLGLIGRLARQFRADKVQLVHTHHLCQLIYGGIAGRLAGARVVHTEHEFYTIGRRRAQRILRILSVLADVVTAVAEPVTEFLRHRVGIPRAKLKTIPNGVDVVCFQSARPVTRAALGWRDEDVVIGCVARLEPEKGHTILLDAFRRVHARLPQTRLLLIGDGSERRRLTMMVDSYGLNGAVRFLGMQGEIPELLATCDLVTLASFNEGLPMAALEAMAAGKPVVATRVGDVPAVVEDGKTGLLVPSGDVGALAGALAALIADQKKRQWFGSQAIEVVKTRYSFDRTLEQYEEVYAQVMSRG